MTDTIKVGKIGLLLFTLIGCSEHPMEQRQRDVTREPGFVVENECGRYERDQRSVRYDPRCL